MVRAIRSSLLAGAVASVALWSVAASLAQRARAQHSPEAGLVAREVLLAMGSDKQVEVILPQLMQQMANVFKTQRPGASREIDAVFELIGKRFAERKNEMLDLVAPVYAARFSEQELREMLAFFKTPVGAKLAAELPSIAQESMRIGMVWGRNIGKELESEVRLELRKRGINP